jgi:cardiolipin synthase A/B
MQFSSDNQVKLLCTGAAYFPALEQAIEQARVAIYLQTYIYAADNTGIRIGNALKRAALRGVSVNLLLDGFGSKDLPSEYIAELQKSGVKLMFYRPKISPWTLQKRRLIRMHRKVSVIDGEIGFVGGINMIDDNNTPGQTPPRIDYAVRLEGSVVLQIQESVCKLWQRMSWIARLRRKQKPTFKQLSAKAKGNTKVAFVTRSNVLHRHDIEDAYLQAIRHAQSEIIIANAYFLPSKRFRKALLAAAARGVNVKLLLQGRKEYLLMFATHALYSSFLRASITIYEYRKSFLHSKVAIIDSQWSTVGSSNIDPFSLMLANEANVVIEDSAFANELKAEIEQTISQAEQVTLKTWEKTSLSKRFFSWLVYAVVKIFLGFVVNANEKE